MLKRINWKAVLVAFTWLISLSGLVVLMGFIEGKKAGMKCSDLKILIPGIESFIDRKEVEGIIRRHSGSLVGDELHSIDIQGIEQALKSNPYIVNARVFADMDGVINVRVSQREPVLRILNYVNQDFYVDKDGVKLPVSASFTPHVLVASGFIVEGFSGKVDTLQTKVAKDLYRTAVFIAKDSLWNEQIEQLYVNDQREIEMVPRVGDHKIILGEADSLEVKFRNLLAFYMNAIPRVGWDAYKTISIKYANQIVCQKATADSTETKSTVADPKPAPATIQIIKDTLTAATTH